MVLQSASGKTVGNEITCFEQSLGDEVEVLPVRSQFIRTARGCTMFHCSLCFGCLLVRNIHLQPGMNLYAFLWETNIAFLLFVFSIWSLLVSLTSSGRSGCQVSEATSDVEHNSCPQVIKAHCNQVVLCCKFYWLVFPSQLMLVTASVCCGTTRGSLGGDFAFFHSLGQLHTHSWRVCLQALADLFLECARVSLDCGSTDG